MVRFIRLMLLLLALATAPAALSPAASVASPMVHGRLDHHGPGAADHRPDHICIGCAVPSREPAAPVPAPMLGLGPASHLLLTLADRALPLDPPPPKRAA